LSDHGFDASVVANRTPHFVAAPDATADRVINDRQFILSPPTDLTGQHILIVDDTWTSGSRAQSAALAVRRAGAHRVGVLVVGRWLDPDYAGTAPFLKALCSYDFDPRRGPVTGNSCP
jgi:adenine/guanine phosphoribosyltransferase-like PRPP-binding protein